MEDGDEVHDEDQMVDSVEDFVGDLVTKVRSSQYCQQHSQDTVSCNHNLLCKFGTERRIARRTDNAEEGEEEDTGKEHDDDRHITQVDMHPQHSIERHNLVNERLCQRSDGESGHGERDECHLKENGVHGTEFESRTEDF